MIKKVILISTITFLIFLSPGCGKSKKEDIKEKKEKTVIIKEENVIKDQIVEEFKFTNTFLKYENGVSRLVTQVTNTSTTVQTLQSFSIIVKDKNGNKMISLLGVITDDQINAGETKKIISNTSLDLTKAKSIEYKINR